MRKKVLFVRIPRLPPIIIYPQTTTKNNTFEKKSLNFYFKNFILQNETNRNN